MSSLRDYVETPARQAATLQETAHRPWPVPPSPWIQGQTWDNLLFMHWRVPGDTLRDIVPPQLPVDEFDGSSWLGITPFRVSGFRLRGTFPVPVLSSFLETNVRTYVTVDDKPGIYFFSLDAESPLAVEAARRTYRLPYYRARMSATRRGEWIDYRTARREGRGTHELDASYRPTGPASPPEPGTLEHFLTERYCLYTLDERQDVQRADIHHPPWPLRPAEAEVRKNTMPPPGIELPDDEPLLHYAERQDVVIWPLVAV